MIPFFINKFEYNYHCNGQIIDQIERSPSSYVERVQRLIGHTLNAQNIWNYRILGQPPTQMVWDTFGIERLHFLNEENHELSIDIVKNTPLSHIISYADSKGDTYSNSVENILFHIINHSSYHRGQLVTTLKQNRVVPISTDYILYKKS
ncbi:MAG: DinB family protein [Bacteroidota bacterium]